MKKPIIKFFILIGIVALVLVCLSVLILSLLFSGKPAETQPVSLNYSAWFSANHKMKKEADFIRKRRNLSKNRTVFFTRAETNSMLYMSLTAHNTYSDKNSRYRIQRMDFSGTDFTVYLYVDLKHPNPFGRVINCKIVFVPHIEDGVLGVQVNEMKIGRIAIPVFLVNYFIQRSDGELNNNSFIAELTEAIKTLEVKNNSVEIIYNPGNMVKLLSSRKPLNPLFM